MNSMRKLFYLLTVLAMLTVAFSGIGCEGGSDTKGTTEYDADSGNSSQREGSSATSDGATGGVDVPMPAGSGTSDNTDDTETE